MSKLRTNNPLSPERLIFTVVQVDRPVDDASQAKAIELHACADNIYAAQAAYDALCERHPGRPLMLIDDRRIIRKIWVAR